MTVSKCLCGDRRCKSWTTTVADGTYDKERAHLLDAAPELLEALEFALTRIDGGTYLDREAIKDARAAIAKAKGETA